MTTGFKRRRTRSKDIENPHRLIANLYKDYLSAPSQLVFYQALVVKIDHEGGKLQENPTKNPKSSIKAAIINDSYDAFTSQEDLHVFWPLFSHDVMPIKEGEHVYVMFLDENHEHGVWISRVAESLDSDDKNFSDGLKKYQVNNTKEKFEITHRTVLDAELDQDEIKDVKPSDEFKVEQDQPFVARIGDRVIEGSNNTAIILSRDRVTDVASGVKDKSGTIDLVAGRTSKDIDLVDDKSRIIVTVKSDVDKNFKTDKIGKSAGEVAAVIVKSDEIRIIARKGMKIVVEGGDLYIDAKTIYLGKDAKDAGVLGDKLVDQLSAMIDKITQGPIGLLGQIPVPTNPAVIGGLNQIKATLKQKILSKKNKIE